MSQKNKLPPGKYYIGDPCYVIDDWDSFCSVWFSQPDNVGVFDFDGHDICVFYTQHGDGCYECSDGSMLSVDAGLIGAIPAALMTRGGFSDGTEVDFGKHVLCSRSQDGILRFGNIFVTTGDEGE